MAELLIACVCACACGPRQAGSTAVCDGFIALPALDAAAGRRLALNVTAMSISCSAGSLVIRGGPLLTSPVVAEYCGKATPFLTPFFESATRWGAAAA